MTTKEFLELNVFSESYSGELKYEYEYGKKPNINLDCQSDNIINKAENDIEIFKERIKKFNENTGFRIGDYIDLPDGQSVQMTHIWSDGRIQTGGNGSMYLSPSGNISRSGALDSGLKSSDLILTNETRIATVWIFHSGSVGGGRGVHYKFPFRVYKTKKGADLSGVPQVEDLRKQKIKEQTEQITLINGNGNEYKIYMPEIYLENVDNLTGKNVELFGIDFKIAGAWLIGQPMRHHQINEILKHGVYTYTYQSNCTYKNKIFIKKPSVAERIKKQWPTPGPFYKPK